ncbi:MAG: class I SAM-dependent methyltransferase [Phycisphaera sp.]|nr:MAG: class I SAM-dependent methyltransferase [Phycisphaera sp.]
MPMTQGDIKAYYEEHWRSVETSAQESMAYANPVEVAVCEPIFEQFFEDCGIARGCRVMDIGCGSGRWIRFLHRVLCPKQLVGVDYASSSIGLMQETDLASEAGVSFQVADITQQGLDIGQRFDLVNIANVLFHIPEDDKFDSALVNLRRHLAPGGRVFLTDYLPRSTMRTEWMKVRSRYEWHRRLANAGLRIAGIRPICVFANDPMGIDGSDEGTRKHFDQVRTRVSQLGSASGNSEYRAFLRDTLVEIENAILGFCEERIAPVDMPSQKLICLVPVRG